MKTQCQARSRQCQVYIEVENKSQWGRLTSFMEEFNLFSSNTSFMKPKYQLCTFKYPKSGRAQLDYLIFRKRWRNSVKDSRSYPTFSNVSADHRLLSATLKISLTVSKRAVSHPNKRIDWKEVSSHPQMSEDFAIQVFNKFQLLSATNVGTEKVKDVYSSLIKRREEVALATLSKK